MDWNTHTRQMRVATFVVLIFVSSQLGFAQEEHKSEQVSCNSVANVAVPKYRIGQNLGGTTTSDTFILLVSVKPSEISREKMMALACKLGSVYGDFDAFILQVFDEHMAAVLYTVGGVDMPYPQANLRIRATYDVDKPTGSSWFKWFPEGGDWVRAENIRLIPSVTK